MNIVVIGSGFGGLSAAIRLAAQGHDVTVVEKRDQPGGRAYVYEQDGFTFDGGPTIITVPQFIHELFELAGKKTEDYVKLVPLDPFYNVRFTDGSVFHYNSDSDYLIEQIRAFNPADVEGYQRFCVAAENIFKKGLPLMEKPFIHFTDMLKVAPDMIKLQTYKSVTSFVNQYIKDERLQQVFSFHPLLIGGNPFQSTSIYAMIHKLEQAFGIWFPLGGTGALVRALVRLFQEIGGKLLLNTSATEIALCADAPNVATTDARRLANASLSLSQQRFAIANNTRYATGVHLENGEFLPADAVVSNADVAFTYLKLVPPQFRRKYTDKRINRLQYSMSLFVLYFGTNRKYEHMAHHEILMGPRYRSLMQDIFDRKFLAQDFSLYLHHPSVTDPSLAPPGCDCWYVLSPVPHLGGKTDWKTMAKQYRDAIVSYLEKHYLPDLSKHIVTETYIDPLHFRDALNSHLGSAFSVEPILTQSAWFRPHNRSEDIPNLYLVGAGTHPGAGLPGVMSSAKIVAQLIGV